VVVSGRKCKIKNVNDSNAFQLSLSLISFLIACTDVEKRDFKERVFHVKSDLGET